MSDFTPRTSLWLLLIRRTRSAPRLPKPVSDGTLLVAKGINPRKQRKGVSGELPRRR